MLPLEGFLLWGTYSFLQHCFMPPYEACQILSFCVFFFPQSASKSLNSPQVATLFVFLLGLSLWRKEVALLWAAPWRSPNGEKLKWLARSQWGTETCQQPHKWTWSRLFKASETLRLLQLVGDPEREPDSEATLRFLTLKKLGEIISVCCLMLPNVGWFVTQQ